MSTYEIFKCDVCENTYKLSEKERSQEFHGSFTIYTYGERKGYVDNHREAGGDICDHCCTKLINALGIEING